MSFADYNSSPSPGNDENSAWEDAYEHLDETIEDFKYWTSEEQAEEIDAYLLDLYEDDLAARDFAGDP